MPTERMEEVEVVANCTRCGGMSPACHVCKGSGYEVVTLPAASGSLTAARLRLADAAEAWAAKWLAPVACADADEWVEMLQAAKALAALRTARGA